MFMLRGRLCQSLNGYIVPESSSDPGVMRSSEKEGIGTARRTFRRDGSEIENQGFESVLGPAAISRAHGIRPQVYGMLASLVNLVRQHEMPKAVTAGAGDDVPEIRYLCLLGLMTFMLLDGPAVFSLSFPVIKSLIEKVLDPQIEM